MSDAEKAAWRAGAEAMREAAALLVKARRDADAERYLPGSKIGFAARATLLALEDAIRALPLPEPPDA